MTTTMMKKAGNESMRVDTFLRRLETLREKLTPPAPLVIRCHWGGEPFERRPGEQLITTKWRRLALGDEMGDDDDDDGTHPPE
jgi:hypothetical protein